MVGAIVTVPTPMLLAVACPSGEQAGSTEQSARVVEELADGNPSSLQKGGTMSVGARTGPRAVVTGAAGFIGSHLTDRLLSLGYCVTGVDRRDLTGPLAAQNLAGARSHPCFTAVRADITEADLDVVVADAETVFHLAAVPGVRPSWGTGFPGYVASNIVGTQRLLGACERAGVHRLVYASSSSVYGMTRATGAPSRETDRTLPISPYGVTKLAAEQLCLAHASRPDTDLTVAALRYFTVYGPRQRQDMAISRLLAAALTGTQYPLFGDGQQQREFTYVDDVVDATVAAARASVEAAVINIGGGSRVSLRHVLELAAEITGVSVDIVALPAQPGDVSSTAADTAQAERLLGYRPGTGLRAGMARHTEWLRRLPPSVLTSFTSSATDQGAAA
jgi:nucleoside-diphosphate-sugar epimerase